MSSLKKCKLREIYVLIPRLGNESGESSILTSSQVSKLEKRILGVSIVAGGVFPGVIKIEGYRKTICTAASDFAVRRDAAYFRETSQIRKAHALHIYICTYNYRWSAHLNCYYIRPQR